VPDWSTGWHETVPCSDVPDEGGGEGRFWVCLLALDVSSPDDDELDDLTTACVLSIWPSVSTDGSGPSEDDVTDDADSSGPGGGAGWAPGAAGREALPRPRPAAEI